MQQQSQEVCKCIYHENIDLICTSLTNFSHSKMLEIDYKLVGNANNIWRATLCDIFKEDCIWQKCENCSSSSIYQLFEPLNMYHYEEILLSQWEYVVVKKDNNSTKIIKKVQQKLSVESVLAMLEEQLVTFSIHNYTNIVQLHSFKYQKEHLKQNEIVISEDFSKNYSLKQQNEIMSAHWTQEQISLSFVSQFIIWKMEKRDSSTMYYAQMI